VYSTTYLHEIHLRATYLSLLAFNASPSLHSHTPPLFQGLEKDS